MAKNPKDHKKPLKFENEVEVDGIKTEKFIYLLNAGANKKDPSITLDYGFITPTAGEQKKYDHITKNFATKEWLVIVVNYSNYLGDYVYHVGLKPVQLDTEDIFAFLQNQSNEVPQRVDNTEVTQLKKEAEEQSKKIHDQDKKIEELNKKLEDQQQIQDKKIEDLSKLIEQKLSFDNNNNRNSNESDVAAIEKKIDVMKGDFSYYKGNYDRINANSVRISKLEKIEGLKTPNKIIWCKLKNGSLPGSGQYWRWAETEVINNEYFKLENNNDTVTILKGGIYQVDVRAGTQSTANQMMSLRVNGTEITRTYCSSDGAYNHTYILSESFKFDLNSKLQVYHTFTNGALNGNPHNSFTITYLGE